MNEAFFKSSDRPRLFGFAANPLDRVSDRREDEAFLTELKRRPDARALVICRDTPILRKDADRLEPLFALPEIDALGQTRQIALLGLKPDGAPVFAALLDDDVVNLRSDASDGFLDRRVLIVPGRDDLVLIDMRSIAVQGLIAPELVGMFGAGQGAHALARAPRLLRQLRRADAGRRRRAGGANATSARRSISRAPTRSSSCWRSTATIACSAARRASPSSCIPASPVSSSRARRSRTRCGARYSRRRGSQCGAVAYLASQPWPFPASLMIGCIAQAATRELKIDGVELEDARWFSRSEVASMLEGRHPAKLSAPHPMAIANHIVRAWVETG